MNNKYKIVILLLTVFAFVLLPEASALPSYVAPLVNEYGSGLSCGTCHVNNSEDGPRNSYGTLFEKQSNHTIDPAAALKAIGAPPKSNATSNATAKGTTVTYTPAATSTLTSTPAVTTSKSTETPAKTATSAVTTSKPVETPARTASPAVTTMKPPETAAAPGFGIVLAAIGLLALVLLTGRKNKY